jgi:hypothetical protein
MQDKTPLSASSPASNADSLALVVTACAVGVLFIFLVYSGHFVFGSKAGHWVYPYFESVSSFPAWIPGVVLLSLGISIFAGSKFIHSHEKITLIGAYLNAVFMQAILHKVYPIPLGTIVQSDTADSFYTPAIRYSALDILTRFNQLDPSLPPHARSNMPGKILLFEFLKVFTSSPRIMGYLIIALSSLGALLLYGICKQLFHDKRIAFYSLILYSLIPCKLFFFPILNTVTPVITLLCLYLFVAYIENKYVLLAWLLGIGLYIQCLFEPLPLITGLICLGILSLAIYQKKVSGKDVWKLVFNLGLGFLSVYILFAVFFSFRLFKDLTLILNDAVDFDVSAHRGYWIWLGQNIKTFFYGVGVPIAVLTIYMTVQIFVQWKTSRFSSVLTIENVFLISIVLTLFLLDLAGINRGEITRLWIFMAVFFQVPTAIFMAKHFRSVIPFFLVAGTLAVQSLVTLHLVGFIIP